MVFLEGAKSKCVIWNRVQSGNLNVILALSPTTSMHSHQGAGVVWLSTDFTDKKSIWAHIIIFWRHPVFSSYFSFRSADDYKVTIRIILKKVASLTVS